MADRLRKARESAGLEQRQLAELAGISRATISAAENGSRPARATLRLWAMATGVPVGWIEDGRVRRRVVPLRTRSSSLRHDVVAGVLAHEQAQHEQHQQRRTVAV